MNDADTLSALVLLTGVLVVCNILISAACKRLGIPALVFTPLLLHPLLPRHKTAANQ